MWHDARMIAAVAVLGLSTQTKAWGLNVWQEALLFGIISSLSLPIGALLGQWLSPVEDYVVAALVAFGGGALLFAVTVELYGHALHEVAHGSLGYTEMVTTVACALLGALLYLWRNKVMEQWIEGDEEEGDDEAGNATASSSAAPKAAPKAEPKAKSAAGSRWDALRRHASDVGEQAVKEKRKMLSAKEAIGVFLSKTTPDHAEMKAVRGRKKRMLLAAGATHMHPTYGSIEHGSPDEDEETKAKRVEEGMRLAYAMFLGLLVDGIPESILLGFLAAENSLSLVLVLSLFVANFPEAFSSASLMKEAEAPLWKIMGMWTFLCALTGILAGLACAGLLYFAGDAAASGEMPFHMRMIIAVVEGIAGGAMIACIAAVMLPEAFGRKHQTNMLMDPGFLCTAGFLCAVLIKVIGGYVSSDHLEEASHKDAHEHAPKIAEGEHSSLHSVGSFEATISQAAANLLANVLHSIASKVF